MPIRFTCPLGHKLSASESKAGKTVRCPACGKLAIVPGTTKRDSEDKRKSVPPPPKSGSDPPPLPSARKPTDTKSDKRRSTQSQRRRRTDERSKPKGKAESELPKKKPAAEKPKEEARPELPKKRPEAEKPREKVKPELPKKGLKADKVEEDPKPGPSKLSAKAAPRDEKLDGKKAKKSSKTESVKGKTRTDVPPPVAKPRRKYRGPKLMPADVYQADRGKIIDVRWLALILLITVAFSLVPVFWKMQLSLGDASGWARTVVLLSLVQLFFIAWMINAPDFASVWIVMVVFAVAATLYAVGTAMVISTPLDRPMLLGMGEIRHSASTWCFCVLGVMSLATYLCGRTSAKWRRTVESEMARRNKR